MDVVDDILRSMRLTGAVFLDAEFTAPWCVTAQVGPQDCQPFMTPPAHIIAYHYVIEGGVCLFLEGAPTLEAQGGDLLIFVRNDAHVLASGPGLRPVSGDDLIQPPGPDGIARIRLGGGGARARIFCGFLGTEDRSNPIVASLPPVLKLSLDAAGLGEWIEASMRYAVGRFVDADPAAASELGQLSEILFTEAVRRYVKSSPEDATGWVAGLRDPVVARALALVHTRFAKPWSLDELAREAGISRSALGERFARHVGMSPMRYLNHRRLQEAADMLRHGSWPVSRIANEVGYESEAAFSRSFKRAFDCSPAAFRKLTADGAAPLPRWSDARRDA